MRGRLQPAAHGTNTDFREIGRYQNVVHRHIQQGAQCVEIVHRGQTLAPLPFVDGLGFLKAEELLKVPDGQSLRLTQPADVGPGSGKVDDRELIQTHDDRLHSGSKE